MKKKISMLLMSLVVALNIGLLSACGSDISENADSAETIENVDSEFFGEGLNEATVIRIGFQTNNVYKVVDDEKQWIEEEFEKDGIEVEWVEFTSGPPLVEALTAGSIDIGTQLGDTPFVNAVSSDYDILGIAVSPYDPKAFSIVIDGELKDEITSIEDLKGKTVGWTVGTAGQDFLLQEFEAAGITENDLELINLSSTDAMISALVSHEVDAITALEPNASKIVLENDAEILDFGESQKRFLNVAVASQEFAEKNPELVARYVKVALQINDYIQENTESVKETISELTEIPVEALTNYDRFAYKDEFDDDVIETLENTQAFLYSQGLLDEEVDFTGFWTNKYVEEAKRLQEEE